MNRSVNNPQPYRGVGTMIKSFKAMWHWYMKVQRKQGTPIEDIVQDIDGQDPKPHFNYITIEQLEKLCNVAKYDYKVLMLFLFDTGIRAPTELMNVKVSDLEWDEEKNHYSLSIREETSKTFGRRIKLLLCSELLRKYITTRRIKKDDFIFTIKPQNMNTYLKRLAFKHIQVGSERKERRQLSSGAYHYYIENGLTLYDFRHSSACYWLPRYKSESALKYRFGWVKSSMIHYYTELLGMRDTIDEEDLYLDVSKTKLEKEITSKGNEITMLQEQLSAQENRMEELAKLMTILQEEKLKTQKSITVFLE
jgi:integrase